MSLEVERMSEEENLRVERRDAWLWITLNRAEKANALAVAMMEGATAALHTARADRKRSRRVAYRSRRSRVLRGCRRAGEAA